MQEAFRRALEKFGIDGPKRGKIRDDVEASINATRQQGIQNADKYVSNETFSSTNWETGKSVGSLTAKAYAAVPTPGGGIRTVVARENSWPGDDVSPNTSEPGLASQIADALSTAGKRAVPVLTRVGNFIGDSLMTPAEAASPSGLLLRDPTPPNFPNDETQGITSDKPERRLSRRIVNPSLASASQATVPAVPFVPSNEGVAPNDRASFSDRFGNWTSSLEGITPRNPNLPVAPPAPSRPLGFFTGKPMPLWTTPPPLGGLLSKSESFGNGIGNWYEALTGGASSPAGGPNDTRSPPAPEQQESQGPLSLNEA